MQLHVHEINQMASGGSYVCIFDADVQLRNDGEFFVTVEKVEPSDTTQGYVEAASNAIRAGAIHVLASQSLGADIQITRLVVNSVDFKPNRYALHGITT